MNHWNGSADSVMSTIMSMTTPPSLDNSKGKKKNDKRMVSKEANCKGCGEPGDVFLTCKSCSVCYHPLCDDPPRDEDLVKDMVDWKCRSCRNKYFWTSEDEEEGAEATAPVVKGHASGLPSRRAALRDAAPQASGTKEKSRKKKKKKKIISNPNVMDTIEKIMKTGVESCKKLNPSMFEIPTSFRRNDYVFPGASRGTVKKSMKRNIIDLDSEIVPKPTALCFECRLSCRKAPLIQCDYCPSYFHFDCLSPPLTTPPGGIWMCPLHPEPFLESTRLTSSALSERIRLWDVTHQQHDPQSVVLSFMQKTQRNPLYSFRKRFPQSNICFTPRVPAVKDYAGVPNNIAAFQAESVTSNILADSADQISAFPGTQESKINKMDVSETTASNPISITEPAVSQNSNSTDAISEIAMQSSEEDIDKDSETPAPKRRLTSESSCTGIDLLLEAAAITKENGERRLGFLQSIPVEQVYNLAFQRLEDLDAKLSKKSATDAFSLSPRPDSTVENPAQIKKKTLPLIQFLVHNTASQIDVNSTAIEIGLKEVSKSSYAWLNPLKYVNCRRLSSRDLFIFFDPLKLQWEFLTYSPYGVVIDSVLHTLQEPKLTVEKKSDLHDFKMSVFEKRGLKVNAFNPKFVRNREAKCECDKIEYKYATTISNECGGILTVGSTIRIGCLRLTVNRLTIDETAMNGDAA